ncbi:MAG: hypothetical protein U0V75_14665 [Ferruginibacter sp.]
MKKIKDIQQLKAAQKKLARRKAELEKAIRYDWRDVKEGLEPANMGKTIWGSFSSGHHKEPGETGVIASILGELAAGLTKKTVNRAGDKIKTWFSKE